MEYTPKKYDKLLGIPGLSDALLTNHFALYQGYVVNTNRLVAELAALREAGKTDTPCFAEMKRRFGWEFNGMRLHELYFGNMTKDVKTGGRKKTALFETIEQQFGSMGAWEKDFRATGAIRGIGWVVLAHDEASGALINTWIGEHDLGHLAGATPILVMDVFEHAFILDYGTKRAEYIDVFMQSIDWKVANSRFARS